jgi:hypothetical protein
MNDQPDDQSVRLVANLSPEAAQALEEIASKTGMSVTDILHRAIAKEKMVADGKATLEVKGVRKRL